MLVQLWIMKHQVSAQTLLRSVPTDKSKVCKGKGKGLPYHAKQAVQVYFGSSWVWVVEATTQPLHHLEMGFITQSTGC